MRIQLILFLILLTDKRKPPQGVAKHPTTSVQRSTMNGQRPAMNGQRPIPASGAIPKASPLVPKPQGQAVVATCPPPPKISQETHQWLGGYEFRLACEACYTQVPHQYGLYSFRYDLSLHLVFHEFLMLSGRV